MEWLRFLLSRTIPNNGMAPFPDHLSDRWTFLPPVRRCARPASAVLLEVGRPVRLLELGIQDPQVPGQVIDLFLERVHVDGADELDLVA